MPDASLTPQYLTDAQLAQLLVPKPEQESDLAGPVNLQSLYTPMMAQQVEQQAMPGYKSGGKVPSDAQKHAGNYKKDHVNLHGMNLAIENRKGSTRSGKDKSGKEWQVTMPAHYGYIKGTTGADGDQVDAYVGDHHSDHVHVIDQHHADGDRKFDEHKVMMNFPSMAHAVHTYVNGFSDGKGMQRIGAVTPMHVDDFKQWVRSSKAKKAAKGYADGGTVINSFGGVVPAYSSTTDTTPIAGTPGAVAPVLNAKQLLIQKERAAATPTPVAPPTVTNSFGGVVPAYSNSAGGTPIDESGTSDWSPSTADYLKSVGLLRAFKGGGSVANPAMEDILEHDLNNDEAHISAAVNSDTHMKSRFGFAAPATPSHSQEASNEDLGDTLAQYDSPMGQDYLAQIRKLQHKAAGGMASGTSGGGVSDSVSLHDVIDGGRHMGAQKFAHGGQVKSVLHRFKHYVAPNSYVAKPHYRQTLYNPVLTKLRSSMRIRDYG